MVLPLLDVGIHAQFWFLEASLSENSAKLFQDLSQFFPLKLAFRGIPVYPFSSHMKTTAAMPPFATEERCLQMTSWDPVLRNSVMMSEALSVGQWPMPAGYFEAVGAWRGEDLLRRGTSEGFGRIVSSLGSFTILYVYIYMYICICIM